MTRFLAVVLTALALLIPIAASAAPLRAFVAEFNIVPPENSGLKSTLQTLLSTRLAGEVITTVGTPAEADLLVSGSYTQIGKVFSLDASVKDRQGKLLISAFEQGESQDALIPALGKVAATLRAELLKRQGSIAPPPALAQALAQPAPPAPALAVLPQGEPVPQEKVTAWLTARISGAKFGIALVAQPAAGKEFLLADTNLIQLYRQDQALTLLGKEEIPLRMKAIALDTLDTDTETLAFVTIVDGDLPASRVYAVRQGKLSLLAQDLPYLFRVIAPSGGAKRLYVQQMGRSEEFYGDVREARFSGGKLEPMTPVRMPRFGNIFNFNSFTDRDGTPLTTVFSESGYLIVYSAQGEELWRSSERFGGSETYFERRDADERVTGSPVRKRFLEQRIQVTAQGEVLVPQNSGFLTIGDARSYSKFALVALVWNGSSLEERWRTKTSQNYLADFSYQPGSRELVLLEVVQKEGIFGKGASAVRGIRLP